MAIPYDSYDLELDRIKLQLHNALDAREYEHYVRQYDEMRNAAINSSQNYGGAMQGHMTQASMLNMAGVPKMPEPATPLSFLKNADKKLLLTGVVA